MLYSLADRNYILKQDEISKCKEVTTTRTRKNKNGGDIIFADNSLLILLMKIPGIIIAITIHEYTKAAVSTFLGNKIPKSEGRQTLNPLNHLEPIGFIIMLQTGFGWGRPVNVDNSYIQGSKNHTLAAYISAIIANISMALLLCITFNMFSGNLNSYIILIWKRAIYSNMALAFFNIIPVYPLAGSKIFSTLSNSASYFRMLQSEKILQMILMFLLYMGIIGSILNPIILLVTSAFGVRL